jgi:hypothetical protein
MAPTAEPNNKRRFYRHPVNVPIQVHELTSRNFQRSESVDISEGGICFMADRFLAKGATVGLSIAVKDTVFKINGQVAYCNRVAAVNLYRTGIAFQDQNDAFRAKLAEQMLQIKEYQATSAKLGKNLSEEDAAREWIAKYAKHFSNLF